MQPASIRILSLENCITLRKQLREIKQRVVLTNGCFDILHRGHIEYLQQSASLGDFLIVAINSDESVRALKGPDRPLNNEQDRAYVIASLRCVDAAFIFAGPRLANEIRALSPDIYTKAGDYTIDTLDPGERQALREIKADIRILPFMSGYSTTSLLERTRSY